MRANASKHCECVMSTVSHPVAAKKRLLKWEKRVPSDIHFTKSSSRDLTHVVLNVSSRPRPILNTALGPHFLDTKISSSIVTASNVTI